VLAWVLREFHPGKRVPDSEAICRTPGCDFVVRGDMATVHSRAWEHIRQDHDPATGHVTVTEAVIRLRP